MACPASSSCATFILRFFFGHKFERLFGCVPPDRAYLDQSLGGHLSGRAARGSVAPRKMACRSAVGFDISTRFKAIDARTAWPQPGWEGIMTRVLFLSITLGTLVVWDAAAQQLVPKPGKRKRVLCGRLGCEAKTFYVRPGCRADWRLCRLARCLQGRLRRTVANHAAWRWYATTLRCPLKSWSFLALKGGIPRRRSERAESDAHRRSVDLWRRAQFNCHPDRIVRLSIAGCFGQFKGVTRGCCFDAAVGCGDRRCGLRGL